MATLLLVSPWRHRCAASFDVAIIGSQEVIKQGYKGKLICPLPEHIKG